MDFMFDAGHDLYTAGKGVPTMKEFEFNRAVVLKIQELLKQYENVNTHLSHNLFDGVDTSLKARTDLANKLKVKAYISVHADAFSNPAAKGETVFIYTKTGNSTLGLANAINDELKADMSISNRGVKRADFHVLRETNMDAVLIEFGFMTNADDLALLKSDAYRNKCAEMVVRALANHYGLNKKVVAQTIQQSQPQPPIDSADGYLKKGERGRNVQQLNLWLNELDYTTKTDDFYDQYTDAAFRLFLKSQGLPEDTVYTSPIGDLLVKAIEDKKNLLNVDTIPTKNPEMYRLAKFVDTTNQELIKQLKAEGYRLIEVPSK